MQRNDDGNGKDDDGQSNGMKTKEGMKKKRTTGDLHRNPRFNHKTEGGGRRGMKKHKNRFERRDARDGGGGDDSQSVTMKALTSRHAA